MGDRFCIQIECPKCKAKDEAWYAPTCGFKTHTCSCGYVIDLEKLTGISEEDASNRAAISELCRKVERECDEAERSLLVFNNRPTMDDVRRAEGKVDGVDEHLLVVHIHCPDWKYGLFFYVSTDTSESPVLDAMRSFVESRLKELGLEGLSSSHVVVCVSSMADEDFEREYRMGVEQRPKIMWFAPANISLAKLCRKVERECDGK